MPHTQRSRAMFAGAILAGATALLCVTPAHADRIDGDWCDGTRRISVDGINITTPGGNKIQGEYDRHDARFAVPQGEPDAGAKVEMVLQGEEYAQVTFGAEPVKIWRRCKHTS